MRKERELEPGDKLRVLVLDPRKKNLTRGNVYEIHSIQSFQFKVIGDNGRLVIIKKASLKKGKVVKVVSVIVDQNKLQTLRRYTREVEMLCSMVLLGTITKEAYDEDILHRTEEFVKEL